MTIKDLVKAFQKAMNVHGSGLNVDGDFGYNTSTESDRYSFEVTAKPLAKDATPAQHGVNNSPSWLNEAKKSSGKKESDPEFNKKMSGFWGKVGLPNYKTIVGTSFAWCGLFVAASLIGVNLPWQKNGAGAKNWASYGQMIDYKKDGIPKGAILHINHKGNCSSGSSNHVGFSDGDCAPSDLVAGKSINIYGGNQSNAARISSFSVSEICEVRWPNKPTDTEALKSYMAPRKITVSDGCSGAPKTESTR